MLKKLSKELTKKFGNGFSVPNLYKYNKFYIIYKNIFSTLSIKSFLSWSHYILLLSIQDEKERNWYEQEAIKYAWSVRNLQDNISKQTYYRLLSTQHGLVADSISTEEKIESHNKNLEFIKNPMILDFLGIKTNDTSIETVLEKSIINNLQKFLLELGKGYTFVGRQYRIHTDYNDYYVDLVFYNKILKCFVLIDLKTGKINHQDVGQMDMYVRMFDDFIKEKDDNPTLGIVLCSDTDEDIARYSILKGNEQLFATKYKLYLPSEEELRAEIEHQKLLYQMSKDI